MLKEVINDQQLLDICLSLVSLDDKEGSYFSGPAGVVVTTYVCMELSKEKEKNGEGDFTDDEVFSMVNKLVVSKILENLSKKDLIDIDFSEEDAKFKINQKGLDTLDQLGL